jgi:hypothetical protein
MTKLPKTGLASEVRPTKAAPVPMAAPRSAETEIRRVTLRLWFEGYIDVADLAHAERTTIQALFLEGIQRVFAARGVPVREVDPVKATGPMDGGGA